MKKYWFKRKWFGWGWRPSSWEGWLVTLLFLVVIISVATSFTEETTIIEATGSLLVPALLLSAICYMTGESPRWQWGKPKETEDEEKTFE